LADNSGYTLKSLMSHEKKGSRYWDDRFSKQAYAYGEAPNDFLVWAAPQVKKGKVISLSEGEGRNAVYLAQLGFEVTAVDFSSVGLAKAQALAEKHQVKIECVLADLNDLQLEPNTWDVVVSVFSQPESPIRQRLNAQLASSLKMGGALIHESKVSEDEDASGKYPGIALLQREIAPLHVSFAHQGSRILAEGSYHVGSHTTAQILAFSV
jgi:SAM-dependent methyltransferase